MSIFEKIPAWSDSIMSDEAEDIGSDNTLEEVERLVKTRETGQEKYTAMETLLQLKTIMGEHTNRIKLATEDVASLAPSQRWTPQTWTVVRDLIRSKHTPSFDIHIIRENEDAGSFTRDDANYDAVVIQHDDGTLSVSVYQKKFNTLTVLTSRRETHADDETSLWEIYIASLPCNIQEVTLEKVVEQPPGDYYAREHGWGDSFTMFLYIMKVLDSGRLLDINWSKTPGALLHELHLANVLDGFPNPPSASDSGCMVMNVPWRPNPSAQAERTRFFERMRRMTHRPL